MAKIMNIKKEIEPKDILKAISQISDDLDGVVVLFVNKDGDLGLAHSTMMNPDLAMLSKYFDYKLNEIFSSQENRDEDIIDPEAS